MIILPINADMKHSSVPTLCKPLEDWILTLLTDVAYIYTVKEAAALNLFRKSVFPSNINQMQVQFSHSEREKTKESHENCT